MELQASHLLTGRRNIGVGRVEEISYIDVKISDWEVRLERLHFLLKEAPDSRAIEQVEENIRAGSAHLEKLINMRNKDTIRY